MSNCRKCGRELEENITVCPACGTPVRASAPAAKAPAAAAAPAPVKKEQTLSNKPLGAWAYFGWKILFGLPVVGFILLIVFSVGGANNINLRNFARSYWCEVLVTAVIMLALVVAGVLLFKSGALNEYTEIFEEGFDGALEYFQEMM